MKTCDYYWLLEYKRVTPLVVVVVVGGGGGGEKLRGIEVCSCIITCTLIKV